MGWGRFINNSFRSSSPSRASSSRASFSRTPSSRVSPFRTRGGSSNYFFYNGFRSSQRVLNGNHFRDVQVRGSSILCPHQKYHFWFSSTPINHSFCTCSSSYSKFFLRYNSIPFTKASVFGRARYLGYTQNLFNDFFKFLFCLFYALCIIACLSFGFWFIMFLFSYAPVLGPILDTYFYYYWSLPLAFLMSCVVAVNLGWIDYLIEQQVVDWNTILTTDLS